jgi:ribosomal protein L3 glutamine methyltransferase
VSAGRSITSDILQRLASLADWLRYAERRFRRVKLAFGHGTDNPFDEAAWLLLHVTKHPYHDLPGALPHVLTAPQRRRVLALIDQRITTRKPLAHLLHEAWLGEHRFYVDERVIVPRSHIAGLLAEGLAPWVRSAAQVRHVLDMCTGSGCLAILAALAFPKAMVDAVDVSGAALAVAQRNVADYHLRRRVRLIRSDLYAELGLRKYDLIMSNPPYVDARAMRRLPQEYRKEPRLALAGGKDGLDFVRRILAGAVSHLTANGLLIVEIGSGRRTLERAFPRLPFTWLDSSAGSDFVFLVTRRQLEAEM